jgi:hypothetical protein
VADHICRDFEVENDSFRSELRGRPSERNRRMQHGRRRRTYALGRWHALRVAVATIVFAGGVLLSACAGASDVSGVDPSSATGSTETTRAPGTATAPTTAASSDAASLVIDRLFEAFNAQDAEGVAGVFGDDVVYLFHDTEEELKGADATAFWQGYFGRETGERLTGPFRSSDGRTYFLGKFSFLRGGWTTLVFDVEMDGERLLSIGDRRQTFDEVIATGEIDDLYEAFNDQDAERLIELFEGMTYRPPSGEELTGAEAAERWAEGFGLVVTRASGVFAIGDGAYGFATEYREPDSGRSTAYAVEVVRSGGRIVGITERDSG